MLARRNARFLAAGAFVCCSLGLGLLVFAEDAAKRDPKEPAIVTGHVINAEGKPVAGATVEWGNNETRFRQRTRVKTIADGTYRLVLTAPEKANWLAASANGYSARVENSELKPGKLVRNFALTPTPKDEHVVAGEVVDEHNKPVAGARVEAFTPVIGFHSSFSMPTGRDYFLGPDRVCTTDERGQFRITDVYTKEVQLNIQARHRHVNDENYPVKEGLSIMMSGSGQAGVIQGRVVDAATGLPPKDLRDVRIVRRYATNSHKCSSEDGVFRLPGEATLGNSSSVYVYAKGYAAARAEILATAADSVEFAKVELSAQPSLRGKLVDADTGQPIANAPILYGVADGRWYVLWSGLSEYADGHHSLSLVQRDVSGSNGEFWFAEPKSGSRGTIIVLVDGYQRLILPARNRQRDEATGEVLVRLKQESAFEGVVLIDGKPAADVSVSISGNSIDGIDQSYESARTDANGKYRYGRLAPGSYRVNCGPYSRMAKLDKGETATVNFGDNMGPIRIHGKARPDSSINLSPQFNWDYNLLTTRSDAEGMYEIRGLKPGRYSVAIYGRHPGGSFAHQEQEIVVKNDGEQIDLLPKPAVRKK